MKNIIFYYLYNLTMIKRKIKTTDAKNLPCDTDTNEY